MRSLTRMVAPLMLRSRLVLVCGALSLPNMVAARAGTTPDGGVSLPAGGILDQQTSELPHPAGIGAPSESTAEGIPVAEEAQGPSAAAAPTVAVEAMPATAPAAAASDERQQVIQHRSAPVGTARGASEQQSVQRPAVGMGGWTGWDALPLTVVLVLIAAVALLVKKYMPAKRMLTGAGVLDVVARLPLTGKQSLVLVKMGRRLVLLGVTGERITSLDVVQDPDQVAAIIGQVASSRPESMARVFDEALGDEVGEYADASDDLDSSAAAGGAVRTLLEKVRRLAQRQSAA